MVAGIWTVSSSDPNHFKKKENRIMKLICVNSQSSFLYDLTGVFTTWLSDMFASNSIMKLQSPDTLFNPLGMRHMLPIESTTTPL